MKLVTWNCQGSLRTKLALLRSLAPDLVIVQESEDLSRLERSDLLAGLQTRAWFGTPGKKGIAVLSPHSLTLQVAAAYDASIDHCVPLHVSGSIQLNLLAVWTKQHRQKQHSYIGQLYRAVAAYPAFLHAAPALVMGDFNSNAIWDDERPRTNHTAVVARLHAAGLVSAYHAWSGDAQGQERTPTFHLYRNLARAYHIDYCFLPARWMPHVTAVTIGPYDPWCQASDHRPLCVDLDARGLG
jgi:exonuclease III